jgi:hypothetical protein
MSNLKKFIEAVGCFFLVQVIPIIFFLITLDKSETALIGQYFEGYKVFLKIYFLYLYYVPIIVAFSVILLSRITRTYLRLLSYVLVCVASNIFVMYMGQA